MKPLSWFLCGKDLHWRIIVLFVALAAGEAALHFHNYSGKPVPGPTGSSYLASNGYQSCDAPGWILTGAMLPGNALAVRAMRPLYPAIVTVASAFRLISIPPDFKQGSPGLEPEVHTPMDYWRAVRILQFCNCLMFAVALWIFFSMARYFGMPRTPALFAALAAGSSFGFAFWLTQAVPEVFSYFASIVSLAAICIATDNERLAHPVGEAHHIRPASRTRAAIVWSVTGLLIGILLLGKELYNIPIFVCLILLFTRRLVPLVCFSAFVLLPTLGWNYYMGQIVGAYHPHEYLQKYRFVVWLWQDLGPLPWAGRLARLADNAGRQLLCFFQAFSFFPAVLALVGVLLRNSIPRKWLVLVAFAISLYLLFLASDFVRPRLLFIAWPVVYFFAWRTVDYAASHLARTLATAPATQRFLYVAMQLIVLLAFAWLGAQNHFHWFVYG
jgi:hypothetical protein